MRPADSYEVQRVTELRQKGRGWQDVARAIGRSLDQTMRLYGPQGLHIPAANTALPIARPRVETHKVYSFPSQIGNIVRSVCERHGVTLDELKGDGKTYRIAHPRQELMALLMDAGKSSTWVGNFLNRDHATALYGARVHRARVRRAQEAA